MVVGLQRQGHKDMLLLLIFKLKFFKKKFNFCYLFSFLLVVQLYFNFFLFQLLVFLICLFLMFVLFECLFSL